MVRKRSSKQKPDEVQTAFATLQHIIEQTEGESPTATDGAKDPLAVELGRRGGLKGGPARAKALSAKRRREIAKHAIATRWRKRKPSP